eukprot:scaffold5261_cov107-Isochrysis_galbana.AAC.5
MCMVDTTAHTELEQARRAKQAPGAHNAARALLNEQAPAVGSKASLRWYGSLHSPICPSPHRAPPQATDPPPMRTVPADWALRRRRRWSMLSTRLASLSFQLRPAIGIPKVCLTTTHVVVPDRHRTGLAPPRIPQGHAVTL